MLWPATLAGVLYVWGVAVAWRPRLWFFAVPAVLPVLNFAPWNAWLVLDEFDLFLLATLAGAYLRCAWDHHQGRLNKNVTDHYRNKLRSDWIHWLWMALGVLGLVSVWRGFSQAGGSLPWLIETKNLLQTQGYTDPLNSLRVGKSLLLALLFVPLVQRQMQTPQDRDKASLLLGYGLLAGLVAVLAVVLWERVAFPGVFNFSTPYRTTALFWEMHTGGAAIDFYLALATPLAFWALSRAPGPLAWTACAGLVIAVCYAVLTTFSRGVYAAVFLPLAVLGLARWWSRVGASTRLGAWLRMLVAAGAQAWRRRAAAVLALVLLAEITLVLVGGDYMRERLDRSQGDLSQRLEHWQRGLGLMDRPGKSPWDLLLGIGLGRLPARYAQAEGAQGMAGSAQLKTDTATGIAVLALSGPDRDGDLGGWFAINQRVGTWQPGNYRALLQLRSTQTAQILVKLCEKHQIYEGDCYYASLRTAPAERLQGTWQKIAVPLRLQEELGSSSGLARGAVLSVSVLTQGVTVDFASVRLVEVDQKRTRELTRNGDFAHGMAHWMQGAGGYYLPWHIDNLYLELLIERGLLQWMLVGLWMLGALRSLLTPATEGTGARGPAQSMAPFWAASLASVLLLGLVSSLLDVPRLAFAVFLVAACAVVMRQAAVRPVF